MLLSVLVIFLACLSYLQAAPASGEYSRLCDSAFCRILQKSYSDINAFKTTVDEGSCIPKFGSKADEICNTALEQFSLEAPLPDDDKDNEALYDRKIEELEKMIDAPLHVLYLRQLALLREKALRVYRSVATSEGSEFDAMVQADEIFRREAEDFTRQNPEWKYSKEASLLKSSLQELSQRSKKLNDQKVASARAQQNTMQVLNNYQQQLQAIQQQMSGASSPWSIGAAYRIPDTNINLQLGYQQGRGNIQVSCVPDEAISLLGPNGFVNGVTPGNVGLSFNINI